MMEFIKSIQDRNQTYQVLSKISNPIVCEVGVRLGDYFDILLTPNVIEAYGVDIWRSTDSIGQNDNLYNQEVLDLQYNKVFNKYKNDNRVRLIREFSVNAAKFFPDYYFDFIYIDADHTYEAVKKDLESWYPKLKKNGILSGHDYISGEKTLELGHSVPFGVIEAVSDFRKVNNIKNSEFHVTNELYGSYFILKL